SNFDTVMELYSSNGTRLRFDDDSGGNLTSKFNLGLVPGGSYYLTIGSFGTNNIYDFQDGAAIGGDDAGALVLNMNGGIVYNGNHAANTLDTFTFTIVPEPASFVALGLGALVLLRRRKR
ncbi:MAG: PEP-CTERM sorting domain-containing protein, partial [Armatimonadota bacterium]